MREFLFPDEGKFSVVYLTSETCTRLIQGGILTINSLIYVAATKVMDGRPDGRCKAARSLLPHRVTNSTQLNIAFSFLQMKYHSEGEFLPEKFQFDARSEFYVDSRAMVPKHGENPALLDDLDSTDGDTDDDRDTRLDDRAEAESRRLDAMTLDAISCSDPFKMAHVGPGSNPGPRKYLGVVKPVVLYECMLKWCASTDCQVSPSFTTFLRALKQARPWIRFSFLDLS